MTNPPTLREAVAVPDIPGPRSQLCWQQGPTMARCDRARDHAGPHTWETEADETRNKRRRAMTNKTDRYVIVRTYSAGVFAGTFVSRKGQEVVLTHARRLWYWRGAASLSQLACEGTSNPGGCKFPAPVTRVELLQAIEILDCTPQARASIEAVQPWRA